MFSIKHCLLCNHLSIAVLSIPRKSESVFQPFRGDIRAKNSSRTKNEPHWDNCRRYREAFYFPPDKMPLSESPLLSRLCTLRPSAGCTRISARPTLAPGCCTRCVGAARCRKSFRWHRILHRKTCSGGDVAYKK